MPNIIVDCMNYITNNISKPISLSDLSAQFNFNGNYLSHLFKKHTGLNLRDYIVQNRLQIAKKELLMGASVTEACYRSGFNDYSNFIRTFTKLVGISPGRYKKNCPKNIE